MCQFDVKLVGVYWQQFDSKTVSIEESQAIELSKKQSHFEEVFGQIEKNPSGKKHKKHHGHHGQHGKHKKKSHSTGSNASGPQEGQASPAA